jgi:hypothetical protein
MFTWPNYLRNFVFNQYFGNLYERGRTVFGYPQWDIDQVSFVLQEARVFVMIVLISVLWQRWSLYAADIQVNTREWASDTINIAASAERAVAVSDQVSRWQSHSLLLAITFLPWSWFFWSSVADLGDNRYIYTALLIHVMWGITWYFLSLPLLYSWRAWSDYRLLAIGSMLGRAKGEADLSLAILREIQPLSYLQFAGASIVAIAAFLWPVIQLLESNTTCND